MTRIEARDLVARPASSTDHPGLQRVLEACEDYFLLVYGRRAHSNELEEVISDRPPELREDQTHLWALLSGDRVVGLLEFLSDFPAPREWYVGFLLLNPDVRSEGRGSALMSAFEKHARARGAEKLRVAVAEQGDGSRRFWSRQGFTDESRVGPKRYGVKDSYFWRMTKSL